VSTAEPRMLRKRAAFPCTIQVVTSTSLPCRHCQIICIHFFHTPLRGSYTRVDHNMQANVVARFYGRNALEVTGPELLAKCARDHPEHIHPVGWNEKDGTMWLYPERRDDGEGVPLQIGHEIGTKYKGELAASNKSIVLCGCRASKKSK
jgi:hypothetical protein